MAATATTNNPTQLMFQNGSSSQLNFLKSLNTVTTTTATPTSPANNNNNNNTNQQTTSNNSKPKWSVVNTLIKTSPTIQSTVTGTTPTADALTSNNSDDQDDHFNRHLENLTNDDHQIVEEREEFNDAKLAKLINGFKLMNSSGALNSSASTGTIINNNTSITNNNNNNNSIIAGHQMTVETPRGANEEPDDCYDCCGDDYDLLVAGSSGRVPNDEQPKVFQDEDEDGLILQQQQQQSVKMPRLNSNHGVESSSPATILLNLLQQSTAGKSSTTTTKSSTAILATLSHQTAVSSSSTTQTVMSTSNMTAASVLPTPLAYSRSSSVTSLTSCLEDDDLKSVRSSVASEYSHLPVSRHQHHKQSHHQHISKSHTTTTVVTTNAHNLDNSQTQHMLDDSNGHINVLATGGDTSLLTDILQPESPIACDGDTSLLVSQRAKHKEQQMQCRLQAASLMLGHLNHQHMFEKHSTSNIITNPAVISSSSSVTAAAAATANSVSSTILHSPVIMNQHQSINSYQLTNTPPVKLVSSATNVLPKFLANNSNAVSKLLQLGSNQPTIPILHQQQQQQPPVLFQHQQQPITAAPMSVTYGFMKNSSFGSNSAVAVNQPTLAVNSNQTVMPGGHVQQPQLSSQPAPKFLATNPSMMMMMSHHLNHHHNQPHQTHHHQQTSLRGTAITTSII
jgi:hypothetical protein